MDFLQWYDWITPTNPTAAFLFGLLFSVIAAVTVKVVDKSWKRSLFAFLVGSCVTVMFVPFLTMMGYY
jgi:ABC-type multidrug transport system permease subunit